MAPRRTPFSRHSIVAPYSYELFIAPRWGVGDGGALGVHYCLRCCSSTVAAAAAPFAGMQYRSVPPLIGTGPTTLQATSGTTQYYAVLWAMRRLVQFFLHTAAETLIFTRFFFIFIEAFNATLKNHEINSWWKHLCLQWTHTHTHTHSHAGCQFFGSNNSQPHALIHLL